MFRTTARRGVASAASAASTNDDADTLDLGYVNHTYARASCTAAALRIVLVVASSAGTATSDVDFDPFNPGWLCPVTARHGRVARVHESFRINELKPAAC